MRQLLRRFSSDERGLEAVEYAIITGMIATSTLAVCVSIGDLIVWRLEVLSSALQAPPSASESPATAKRNRGRRRRPQHDPTRARRGWSRPHMSPRGLGSSVPRSHGRPRKQP